MEALQRHPATPIATPVMNEKVKQPHQQILGPAVTFNLPTTTQEQQGQQQDKQQIHMQQQQQQQQHGGNLTPPPTRKRPLTEVSPNVPSPVSREDRSAVPSSAAAVAAHLSMVAMAARTNNKKPRRDNTRAPGATAASASAAAAAAAEANSSEVWPPEVDRAFMEALEKIPLLGRRKLMVHNHSKPCGRNELIADYIFRRTGKKRTRKQVSSHIQVLKHIRRDDAECKDGIAWMLSWLTR